MTHAQNLEPNHASGWFNLGSVQQRSGWPKKPSTAMQGAIEADESYTKAAEKWVSLARDEGLIEALHGRRSYLASNG